MTFTLIGIAGILLLVGFFAMSIKRSGKQEQIAKEAEKIEDALLKAAAVQRGVDTEPDPARKLQDEWRRP